METVAFYSYKGGVGRTLLLADTAQALASSGRRVVALDLDLEAPGLHYWLAADDVLTRAQQGGLRGALDEVLDALDGSPRRALRETAVEVELPEGAVGSLLLIPAGSAPSRMYWEALERLNTSLRGRRPDGGLLEAVLDLQVRIADELAPEFLLLDTRSGITELGGLATSVLADRVVCLTTAAPESADGTRVVAEALRAAPRLPSQQPLRIEVLVVCAASEPELPPGLSGLAQDAGCSVEMLPLDPRATAGESALSGPSAGTRAWIAKAFPAHEPAA